MVPSAQYQYQCDKRQCGISRIVANLGCMYCALLTSASQTARAKKKVQKEGRLVKGARCSEIKNKIKAGGIYGLRRTLDSCPRNASVSLMLIRSARRPFHMVGAAIMNVL